MYDTTNVVLLLDVDGVIADFSWLYADITAKRLRKYFTPEDVKVWDVGDAFGLTPEEKEVVHIDLLAPGAAFSMRPLSGAVEGVRRMMSKFDVWFVTAPFNTNPTWASDRRRWLNYYFGNLQGRKTIHADVKSLVYGNVFIDDKPQNLEEWTTHIMSTPDIDSSSRVFRTSLWDQPYNRDSTFPRVRSWDEVEELCMEALEEMNQLR